jgi:hypothetical protein
MLLQLQEVLLQLFYLEFPQLKQQRHNEIFTPIALENIIL